uniref:Golgi-associated plant pathogenesis-related protein 1 n=2 Tax=Cacopsylla melanoneura TaxID=428564 RepID=A0A8D8Q4Q0_9HEMI
MKGNGNVQFIQPELKPQNTSVKIIEKLKDTNVNLNLVEDLEPGPSYKMKFISDDKRARFVKEVLHAHNKLREHHGTDPLDLEKKLMDDAQSYADECAKGGGIVPRRQVSNYGENIWGLTTNASDFEDFTGGRPVEKWYSEVKKYKFGAEPVDNSAGHLTQLLWSKSKYLGVGMAANDNGQLFVVCEYYPPGNYLGEYPTNVKPLKKPLTEKDLKEIGISSIFINQITDGSPNKTTAKPGSAEELRQNYTLQFHNEKRLLHPVAPLVYNEELESLAKDWAETLLKEGKFYHRPNNKYGENIFFYTASFYLEDDDVIRKSLNAWYNEIEAYVDLFDKEPSIEQLTSGTPTGHFTQVVWKGTTEVGLGVARKDSDESHLVVVVANYAPPGNILGRFRENVFPPIEWKKNVTSNTGRNGAS